MIVVLNACSIFKEKNIQCCVERGICEEAFDLGLYHLCGTFCDVHNQKLEELR